MDLERYPLSARQARAVIVAAERLGFEREPDLYRAWYHHDLFDEAAYAAEHLRTHDPDALRDALVAEEVIEAQEAAELISESAMFTFAHADIVIAAATEHGWTPPPAQIAALPYNVTWDQAQAALAFLWDRHPLQLAELVGEVARLAPLPPTALDPRSSW